MKRILSIGFLLLTLTLLQCKTNAPYMPLFYGVTTESTPGSGQIGTAKIVKSGRSCSYVITPVSALVGSSNRASVQTAMEDGGITKVAVIDRSSVRVLISLFGRECIVVWGE